MEKTLTNIFYVLETLYPDAFEEMLNNYPFSISKNFLESFSQIMRDSKEKHFLFFQFLVSSFDNVDKKNFRDLEKLTDQLLKALPYFRFRVSLFFSAKLNATQRTELESSLNLMGKYFDPTFVAKIHINEGVLAQIDTTAHTLLYCADTFSSICSKYNLTDGSLSHIINFSSTLNLKKYVYLIFDTHIDSYRIPISRGRKVLTNSVHAEEKVSSRNQAHKDLVSLCKHLSLNPKIFLDKWVSTNKTEEDDEYPPHVWLQRLMTNYFNHFETASSKQLLAFGFIGDICEDMREWMKEYSHYHPSSLLSAWFDAKLNSFPGFELPLGTLFSQALNIDNDALVESKKIAPEEADLKLSFYKNTSEDQKLSWLQELKQQFGSSDEGHLWLFHGTSLKNAENIVENGVRWDISEKKNVLGKGFYTTKDFQKACSYAPKIFDSPLLNEETQPFRPCVLAFKVNTRNWIDCSQARELIKQRGIPNEPITISVFDPDEFSKLKRKCQQSDNVPSLYKLGPVKRPVTEVDIVIAPLAIDGGESSQHCFRREKVCNPLIDDLKFIVIINTQQDLHG